MMGCDIAEGNQMFLNLRDGRVLTQFAVDYVCDSFTHKTMSTQGLHASCLKTQKLQTRVNLKISMHICS